MSIRSIAAALAGLAIMAGSAAAGPLLVNGDFESGHAGFATELAPVKAPGGKGLWAEGTYAIAGVGPSQGVRAYHALFSGAPQAGAGFMAVNGASAGGGLVWASAEPVRVTPGTEYAFSGWIALLFPDAPPSLSLMINGSEVALIGQRPAVGVWAPFSAAWWSGEATQARIGLFNASRVAIGNDFGLDSLAFVAVPAPAGLGLLAAGLLGLGLARRRRPSGGTDPR